MNAAESRPKTNPEVVVAYQRHATPESVLWLDHLKNEQLPWPAVCLEGCSGLSTGWLLKELKSLRVPPYLRRSGWLRKEMATLRRARLIVCLGNTLDTQMILLLARARMVKAPVVVLELNVKFNELSRLERVVGRVLYRSARLITVLSPPDRAGLMQRFGVAAERVRIVNQWAQEDRFAESRSERVETALARLGGRFAVASGRSSRNFGELLRAMRMVPGLKLLVVGSCGDSVPAELSGNIEIIPQLSFEEYVYVLRRARMCVIPLLPVQHTCGVRVWFQSSAMGTPVIISRTEAVAHYEACGAEALFYQPGDSQGLAHYLSRLWQDSEARDELARRSKFALMARFGVEPYHKLLCGLFNELLNPG